MLARNAESLYWIGRYVERADDTARILDVTVHQLLEDSSVDLSHGRCALEVVFRLVHAWAPVRVRGIVKVKHVSSDRGLSIDCAAVGFPLSRRQYTNQDLGLADLTEPRPS